MDQGFGLMSSTSYSATATAIVPAPVTQSLQSVSTVLKQIPQKTSQNQNASSRPTEPVVPSPGRFRHPRMTEVAKRRAASSFTPRNVQTVGLNLLALLITWLSNDYVYPAYV